jgi:general secretion pathway protein I
MLRRLHGFTLIEVVVALAILSIGLTVLIELFSGGLRLGRTSGEYSKAVNYGRMKLEEVMTQQSIEEGTDEGKFDDTYRWQVDLKKVDIVPAEKIGPFEPPALLYEIKVDVFWKSGPKERSARFESFRTIKKSEAKTS